MFISMNVNVSIFNVSADKWFFFFTIGQCIHVPLIHNVNLHNYSPAHELLSTRIFANIREFSRIFANEKKKKKKKKYIFF